MAATFIRYLEAGHPRTATDADAYIRVRVSDGPHPDGSMVVYLSDGTALVVDGGQLLRLDTRPDCPDF
jgi:hypothetical protein